MPNTNIPASRVDLVDPRTPNKISREWYAFLYELFRRVGGLSVDDTISDVEKMFLSSPAPTLTPSPFFGIEPRAISDPNIVPAPSIGSEPFAHVGFPYLDWQPRMEASIAQLRQQVNDAQTLAELAPVAQPQLPSGDNVTSDTVSAVGYWSPLTNGDPVTPELVFDMAGDTISVWTPTP